MSWCVYIVKCSDGSLYTGIARDVDKRVKAHNEGKGAKYTRSRRPVRLVYSLKLDNKSLAMSREASIKRLSREQKLALIGGAPMNALLRLLQCGEEWQKYHKRSIPKIIEKMREEMEEYEEQDPNSYHALDELGDIVVGAMRAISELTPKQLEFLTRVSEMKVQRRMYSPGKKDKEAEAVVTREIASDLVPEMLPELRMEDMCSNCGESYRTAGSSLCEDCYELLCPKTPTAPRKSNTPCKNCGRPESSHAPPSSTPICSTISWSTGAMGMSHREWLVVIVTGSRDLSDAWEVDRVLDEVNPDMVVHGGARGADTFAHYWCKKNGKISVSCFPMYGQGDDRRAPLRRNIFMLDSWPMATVLAFPTSKSSGTYHTISEAQKRGMRVQVFEAQPYKRN